ncbi:MAG: type II restriction endonuclease [Bacteroidales bacterium]|nr:type II restriction endonuclease [Bacteroidales bacterium]
MRDFTTWLAGFRSAIAGYKYYTDFEKIYRNVDAIKVELNIMNSLIGSDNIEQEFMALYKRYPEILKCIPILLAKRESDILTVDFDGEHIWNFRRANYEIDEYVVFMSETGLFELMQNKHIHNLIDYVTGVETGLDSNARKNRGGHVMEDLVEGYLIKAGLEKDKTYFKEMYLSDIENKWGIDLSCISNEGSTEKRFDFVIKRPNRIYGIETNFYASSGSKLNETARSYKTLALETQNHPDFSFVWITDGQGWGSARNNLKETFDVLKNMYNILDLEDGVISSELI